MASTSPDRRLTTFQRILELEMNTGYRNRAVAGGLERFLQTMLRDVKLDSRLQELADSDMFSVDYHLWNSDQREAWITEIRKRLGWIKEKPRLRRSDPKPPKKERSLTKPEKFFNLDSPVSILKSVNRTIQKNLEKLNVSTIRDLLYLFPNRHIDYSRRSTVSQLRPGPEQTIVVSLWKITQEARGKGGRLRISEAVVGDQTGNIRVVWFGQPYLARQLVRTMNQNQAMHPSNPDTYLILSGKVGSFQGRLQMESPEWEVIEDADTANLVHTGRLVPMYPLTEGLHSQRTLRRILREALTIGSPLLKDPLSASLLEHYHFMRLTDAISQTHYPDSVEALETARQRLAFDELLVLLLAISRNERDGKDINTGTTLHPANDMLKTFMGALPFNLTNGQQSALNDALTDIANGTKPMSRLLQGEVGSGKTVVALALLLTTIANGYQGALMAPTEVLAEQHYLTIRKLLGGLSQTTQNMFRFSAQVIPHPELINIGLVTGSTPISAKRDLYARCEDGTIDLIIGTHTLIQEEVHLNRLALVVVDEQHRFGVRQRAALREKGNSPHLLVMSATPIPRTLSLTLFGDLDISTITELPSGRKPVITRHIPPERQEDAEAFIIQQAIKGRQSFIVCPLIEESEVIQARAATEEYERLRTTSLSNLRLGLLHGRMNLREKQLIMDAFRNGELDVLVSTPVVEVGIDVPNATVMLIQGSNRFGLSQLHQLRGRIGRGEHQSYCLLLAETLSTEAQRRLDAIVKNQNGFEIAEEDLLLRGPGDFFGTRQSGLPTLRMAQLSDRELLVAARSEAKRIGSEDPDLRKHPILLASMNRYSQITTDELG